jgi:hypothetical protein
MHDQGFEHEENLKNMASFECMLNMLDKITKPGVIPQNVWFSYIAMKGVKAFHAWLLYRVCGESIDPADYNIGLINTWRTRISRLENIVLKSPASVTKLPFFPTQTTGTFGNNYFIPTSSNAAVTALAIPWRMANYAKATETSPTGPTVFQPFSQTVRYWLGSSNPRTPKH